MADGTDTAIPGSLQAKQRLARLTWDAHVAMVRTAHAHPELRSNEAFMALVDTAKARFLAAFEAL